MNLLHSRHSLHLYPAKIFCVFLFILLFFVLAPSRAYADRLSCTELKAYVDGFGPVDAAAYDADYENNTYVSLRSMADILSASHKPFTCTYSFESESQLSCMSVQTGQKSDAHISAAELPSASYAALRLNYLVIDGNERHYWTYSANDDIYMSLTDFAMAFDVAVSYIGPNHILIETDKPYRESLEHLDAIRFFDSLSGVVIGDITSGEILYANNENSPEAIASTSKLMTCLLAYDAIRDGRVSPDDMVTVSANTEKLSRTDDGLIPLSAGQQVPLRELLAAMMLPSSNESCRAVAEHIDGSEAEFVRRMNLRAKELGLTSAHFYNSSGLPFYRQNAAINKLHNYMSAMDLYRLSEALVELYPEVTELTSQKSVYLETLDYTAYNSNPLVFNLPNVVGLKTGTTNRAGCCLVSLMEIPVGDETHSILCVLLDAETGGERCTKSEMLLRCVQSMYE